MKKKKCYNCKFAGQPFKVNKVTHIHCQHEKHHVIDRQNVRPWDTLCAFSYTCDNHEFKETKTT